MPGASAAKPVTKGLDAWAVVAWMKDESPGRKSGGGSGQESAPGKSPPGDERGELGRTYYIAAKAQSASAAELILSELGMMPLEIRPAPSSLVLEAARLKSQYAIPYADAFAVATAIREEAPVVSGDPELKVLVR